MARTTNHPKRCKKCVFCNYWMGDAKLKFVNTTVGYEYDNIARGKCMQRNMSIDANNTCFRYAPNMAASKLL